MQRAYDFLKKAGTYYLATTDGDQPHVRPFGTANIFEGKLYIQTGLVKPVAKQLLANPKAEICAMTGGKWIRIEGKLVLDERTEAQKAMLDAYPNLRGMYSETATPRCSTSRTPPPPSPASPIPPRPSPSELPLQTTPPDGPSVRGRFPF